MAEQLQLHGYVDCSNEEYHSGPGLSKSGLDAIQISPLEYWDRYLNPDPRPFEGDKDHFKVGDGTHKLILEPGTFEQTYAVGFDKSAFPDALDTGDDLKKACQAEGLMVSGTKAAMIERLMLEAGYSSDRFIDLLKKQHEASHEGKLLINADSYRDMLSSINAVLRDPWAGGLLSDGTAEQSFYYSDEDYTYDYYDEAQGKTVTAALLRKCRTDWITGNGEWVVDLKTTDDVSEEGFGRTILKRRYHVQGAWYLDILKALYGKDAPRGFAFIAAQKKRPYDVAVHWVDQDLLELGRLEYRRNATQFIECMTNNYWPGASGGDLIRAKIPEYAMRALHYAD